MKGAGPTMNQTPEVERAASVRSRDGDVGLSVPSGTSTTLFAFIVALWLFWPRCDGCAPAADGYADRALGVVETLVGSEGDEP